MATVTHLPTEPPAHRRMAVLLLLGLCGFLFFYGLNAGELYRTESLRAIVAAEFLRSGDWVAPRLYGEPLLTKPPGAYAAIALASWPFGGVTAWTARLPSALAAALVVFLFFRHFGRESGWKAGLVAASLLPASLMWLDRAPSAEIDMLQLAWTASALLCFLRALELHESADGPAARRWEWLWMQAALLCVAGGALTKWTAPAFFYLTVVPVLWRRGRLRLLWSGAHVASVLVAVLPCLAWAGAVAAEVGWQPLWETVRREALQRLSPLHHPRPYPWRETLEFPLTFLAANLPWSGFALATLHPGFARLWDERGRRLLQTLQWWTWMNLLFWSVVPGHRFRHGLPLQPGLAGLAALVWIAFLTGRLRWPLPWLKPGRVFVGLLVGWLAVKLVFVHVIIPHRDVDRTPGAKGEQIGALVPEEETLYLSQLKDEGILFYYGRPARRVLTPGDLPHTGRPVYCLLTGAEWEAWSGARPAVPLLRSADEQGAPIVLVRVDGG